MKVIKKYADGDMLNTVEVTTQRFQKSIYDISTDVIESVRSKLYPGKTVVLFSGSWRFDFDAIYLEAKIFNNTAISLHSQTYFVEPNYTKLFDKVMYNINATNILILHSGFFCNYKSLDAIVEQMKTYQRFCPKQIVLSIPQERVSFNRLKYSVNDMAQQYQAEVTDNCFIIQLIT